MTRRRSAIPGLGRGLIALLAAALPVSLCRAEPAGSRDPFAGLDAINLSLEIGAPLDQRGSTSPQLFDGDLIRLNRFRTHLTESVGAKLESCGILWDQGAADVVSIDVFGRLEERREGPPVFVYMVEAEVLNTTLSNDRRVIPDPIPLRRVIGVADDAGLEAALTDAAVAIVSDDLTCRQ